MAYGFLADKLDFRIRIWYDSSGQKSAELQFVLASKRNQTGVANDATFYRSDLLCRHLPEIIEGRWRLFSRRKKESNSIANQRKLIEDYLKRHPEIIRVQEFCDDGFTGANFDRPDFQRMIDLVRDGQIQVVIVKDLSCFGRDYLEVSDYLEHIFPFLGVRMISINDHYDSQNNLGNTAGMDVAFKKQIYDFYNKGSSQKTFTFHRTTPLPISA